MLGRGQEGLQHRLEEVLAQADRLKEIKHILAEEGLVHKLEAV